MVFFESPNRIAASLADIAAALGADRRVAVARELTKMYEQVKRGTASELLEWAEAGVKGEIVIVVAGAEPLEVDLATGVVQVLELVADGTRLKDASAAIAEATGLSRRDLYEAALAQRTGRTPANEQAQLPLL